MPPKKAMVARPGIPLLTERGFAAPRIIAAHALTGRVPVEGAVYFYISGNTVAKRQMMWHTGGVRQVSAKIEDAAARLEALGNPTRLAVFRLLVRAGENGLAVGQLQKRLDIAGSTLSHHLRALITVDLVSQERRGTTLTCRANYSVMGSLISFLVDECCADSTCVSSSGEAA